MADAKKDLTAVLVVAVRYAQEYDRANPDVGTGPTLSTLLTRVLDKAHVAISTEQYLDVLAALARGG